MSDRPRAPKRKKKLQPRAEPSRGKSPHVDPRIRRISILGAILLAGLGVIAAQVTRSPGPAREEAASAAPASAAPRRVQGVGYGYTIELPPGWGTLPVASQKSKSKDIDLLAERAGVKGLVFVFVEEIPAGAAIDPDHYAQILLENMRKQSASVSVSHDQPLKQDADNGIVFRVEASSASGEETKGYFATLVTSRLGFRILAFSSIADFPAIDAELRQIIDSFTPPAGTLAPHVSFEEARRTPTKLSRRGPSPQTAEKEPTPAGVQKIHYDSGSLSLQAFWWPPRAASDEKKAPALVFLHGGFAFGMGDLEVPRLFHEAGFAAIVPTFRGENGNPGDYELFRGEVDDAAAAIRWVAARKEVDASRIYVFGHSAGGGVANLLALLPDLPVRRTASAGGAYLEETFPDWERAGWVPFDLSDAPERRVRVIGPFLKQLAKAHYIYAGTEDEGAVEGGRLLAARSKRLGKPLYLETLPGDHFTSLVPAAKRFLALAQADAPSR